MAEECVGSPRTSDFDGPYNLTLLDIPTAQIEVTPILWLNQMHAANAHS